MAPGRRPTIPIVVRDALPDDLDAIVEAHVAAWRVAYRGVIDDTILDDPALEHSRRVGWTRHLHEGDNHTGDPDHRLFVPVIDEQPVGFGHVGRQFEPDRPCVGAQSAHGEVYGFYIHPDAWGTGAADSLMSTCLDELRRRSFSTAVLWVLRDNPRARRFYERSGWTATDNTTTWDGPTMPGAPRLTEPVDEVQYTIDLTS